MKTNRFLVILLAFMLLSSMPAEAQFLKKLGKAVENAAKNTVERKASEKTEQAVGSAIDKATDVDTYKSDKENKNKDSKSASQDSQNSQNSNAEADDNVAVAPVAQTTQQAQMAWNKFDFVSGDEIMFEDNLVGEQLGEFPSMWDIIKGNVEVAKLDGENVIAFVEQAEITPLMKEAKSYLPEIFTIEADFYKPAKGEAENGTFYFYVRDENGNAILTNNISTDVYEDTG
ncbi:MAG: hypothetical protein LBM67_06410, partial [Lentimicrobiaceae bacterium]|nr:hypothetical protein [Lentimicrobiaceae bacterium]